MLSNKIKQQQSSQNWNTFYSLAYRFLCGEKGLNFEPYLYADPKPEIQGDVVRGSDIYTEIISNTPDYYLFENEVDLIKECSKKIPQWLEGDALKIFDLGPGAKEVVLNKTIPLLNSIARAREYVPIDMCESFLNDAYSLVNHAFPKIIISGVLANFYDYRPVKGESANVVLFLGGSIGNVPETLDSSIPYNTISKLSSLKEFVGEGGTLIISQDTNNEHKSLMKAYHNKPFEDHVINLLHLMNRDLPIIGLNPGEFELVTKWHKENYCVASYAKVKKSQTIIFGGKKIVIPEGEELHVCNSYKFPEILFQEMGVQAGFKPLTYFKDSSGRMAIHIWKC